MAKFTSWDAIERESLRKTRKALKQTIDASYRCLGGNTAGFYSGGTPIEYERTGEFLFSPVKVRMVENSKSMEGGVYMDGSYFYLTGSMPTGSQVFEWAEYGEAGIVGLTGTWERTEQDIDVVLNKEFSKYFEPA